MFEKIRYYYTVGLYRNAHMDKFLSAGVISQDEYDRIIKEAKRG